MIMPEGDDHVLSGLRAMRTPDPQASEAPHVPTRATVKIARPRAFWMTEGGILSRTRGGLGAFVVGRGNSCSVLAYAASAEYSGSFSELNSCLFFLDLDFDFLSDLKSSVSCLRSDMLSCCSCGNCGTEVYTPSPISAFRQSQFGQRLQQWE